MLQTGQRLVAARRSPKAPADVCAQLRPDRWYHRIGQFGQRNLSGPPHWAAPCPLESRMSTTMPVERLQRLASSLRPCREPRQPAGQSLLILGQRCESPAFTRDARLVTGIVHVEQPNHARPKAPLAPCGSISGDTSARGPARASMRYAQRNRGALSSRRSWLDSDATADPRLREPCAGQLRSGVAGAQRTKTRKG
jgi:hypothetical protein